MHLDKLLKAYLAFAAVFRIFRIPTMPHSRAANSRRRFLTRYKIGDIWGGLWSRTGVGQGERCCPTLPDHQRGAGGRLEEGAGHQVP